MTTNIIPTDLVQLKLEEFLHKEIKRLGVTDVFNIVHMVDRTEGKYEDYINSYGPNGGDENRDSTVGYIAGIDNLTRFGSSLEEVNKNILKIVGQNGVEDIIPEDLILPDKGFTRNHLPWKTLKTEVEALYKRLGESEFSENRKSQNPSASQITPYLEQLVKLNKAAKITFKRIGVEEVATHFGERAEVLDLLYDQRLASEGKPAKQTEVQDRYEGNDFAKQLASEQIILNEKGKKSLDAYLLIVADAVHPSQVPGFKTINTAISQWNNGKYAVGEKSQKTLDLMMERVESDSDDFSKKTRSPGGYGCGPFFNAVGEFGFTKRDDMIIAMYMHFSGELGKEMCGDNKHGVTYLTWLFEPDFEPTGTLTKEQMLNSKIIKIPSWFVAGETDKAEIYKGMNRFVGNMMRMTGVTHKTYNGSGLKVFPTLYSDLSKDLDMADLVLNYKPKKEN